MCTARGKACGLLFRHSIDTYAVCVGVSCMIVLICHFHVGYVHVILYWCLDGSLWLCFCCLYSCQGNAYCVHRERAAGLNVMFSEMSLYKYASASVNNGDMSTVSGSRGKRGTVVKDNLIGLPHVHLNTPEDGSFVRQGGRLLCDSLSCHACYSARNTVM